MLSFTWLPLLFGEVSFGSESKYRRYNQFPNVPLTDQFGRRFRFRDDLIAPGGPVIVNSMYTNCRGSCPVTSARLSSLRDELKPIFGKRMRILSFTLEPHVDMRSVMLKYSKIFGANDLESPLCDWLFLTGTDDAIDELRHGLVFYDLDPRVDQDVTQHASLLFFGNAATDRWAAMPAELKERTLIDSIRRTAGETFEERYGIPRL